MLLSVFTPSHCSDYLIDAWQSLQAQTHARWEWVLVANGGVEVPAALAADPRVRAIVAPDDVAHLGVGALKRFACEQCRGEVLVELDHDDLLHEQALARIAEAATAQPGGFYYSDYANLRADGSCQVFDAGYGWSSYALEWRQRSCTAMRAFAPSASSLATIYFAPNHVRAWSRAAYDQAGGHDPLLPVCDDYDLLCRSYLAGVPFVHLPECLYFYRLRADGGNTYVQRNKEIQERQQQIANGYLYRLIAEECRRRELPMYDLDAAHQCPAGFRSVDVGSADSIASIRRGLPLPDDSVGCLRAYDFLQRIPHCGDPACSHGAGAASLRCTVGMMNEFYRVLAPGGWLITRTPSSDGRGAFQDPAGASFWNPNSFWYYTRAEQARHLRGMTARFQGNRIWQAYPTPWHETHRIAYVFADLVALKGQHQPGVCEI